MADQQRIVAPFAGHVIGQGISTEMLERLDSGLTVGSEGENGLADGQQVEFKFRMITSQQSLEEELNIGANVDVRYGLFSGSARFSFAQSNSIDSSSTYILASCTVQNALRSGQGFAPTAAAQRLITAGDADGFHHAFGTRFVQALRTGGEFTVLVRVTSSDATHQSKISASLNASFNGLAASADFSAAYEEAQKDTSSHTEVDITQMVLGGQGDQLTFVGAEADRVKAAMDAFPASVHDHAVAYEAELLSYDALALPFPSPDDLDDKRAVLEDCLRQKQRYWSILADLRLAQSPDAPLFFAGLPPTDQLVSLTARFSQLLNDLMAHAQAVAAGTIPPSLFVPTDEPAPPALRRRSSTDFGQWWTRHISEPATLLPEEDRIISQVGLEIWWQLKIDYTTATPDMLERASTLIDKLDFPGITDLVSLRRLPAILDAPLRELSATGELLTSLAGVETFQTLESLRVSHNQITDLTPVTALGGLTLLYLTHNQISDLTPVTALTRLQDLQLGGNRIESLEALRGLPLLHNLALANGDPGENGAVTFYDNPIRDARALNDLPLLRNVLTETDRLQAVNLVNRPDLSPHLSGTADRVGDSNRFDLTPDAGGSPVRAILAAFTSSPVTASDTVVVTVFLPSLQAVAVALADPEDSTRTLPVAAVKAAIDAEPAIGYLAEGMFGVEPTLLLEATAAPRLRPL